LNSASSTYRINSILSCCQSSRGKIDENTIGIAVAKDGIPLPMAMSSPEGRNDDGTEADHKAYQNGQL